MRARVAPGGGGNEDDDGDDDGYDDGAVEETCCQSHYNTALALVRPVRSPLTRTQAR